MSGSGTHSGTKYQAEVASWMAVQILAENASPPPFDLPADITFESLSCEKKDNCVDDIRVKTSDAGYVFIQAKHTLQLSSKNMHLHSCLKQFVNQYFAHQDRKLDRPLGKKDRLIIASSSYNRTLESLLSKIRGLEPGDSIEKAPTNEKEKNLLSIIRGHIKTLKRELDKEISEENTIEILKLSYVFHKEDIKEDTRRTLRSSIIKDNSQDANAWSTFFEKCLELASKEGGIDRKGLQDLLLDHCIEIKAVTSYEGDVKTLKNYSKKTYNRLLDLAKLKIRNVELKIERRSTQELKKRVERGSLLVIGEAGAGKSGAINDLYNLLCEDNYDVVYLAADQLSSKNRPDLQKEIGIDLKHDLTEILYNWPGHKSGFLLIDAIDKAFYDGSEKLFQDIILDLLNSKTRWKIVVSVRKYDLRHKADLKKYFRITEDTTQQIIKEFTDKNFSQFSHFNIPLLSDDEVVQLQEKSKDFQVLFSKTGIELKDLVRNLFNLRLAIELINTGIAVDTLAQVQTQMELLREYWSSRKITRCGERILEAILKQMLDKRELQVDFKVNSKEEEEILEYLIRWNLLKESEERNSKHSRPKLRFSHNILFDYAVFRILLLGLLGNEKPFYNLLEERQELILLIRPSIEMLFHDFWEQDICHKKFWETLYNVNKSNVSRIGKLIGSSVASQRIGQLTDYKIFIEDLKNRNSDQNSIAKQVLGQLVNSILSSRFNYRAISGDSAPPWSEFLEICSSIPDSEIARTICSLLERLIGECSQLTTSQKRSVGVAARRLLKFGWDSDKNDLILQGIKAICLTYETAPSESESLLRRCIEPEHMEKYAIFDFRALSVSTGIPTLIDHNPQLISDIYQAVFSYEPKQGGLTGGYIIQTMITNHGVVDNLKYNLAQCFDKFLRKDAVRAIKTLVEVVNLEMPVGGSINHKFEFSGKEAIIQTEYDPSREFYERLFDDSPANRKESSGRIMLREFKVYLQKIAKDPTRYESVINLVVEYNKHYVIWTMLIECGIRKPEIFADKIKPLALVEPILISNETSKTVGDFLRFAYHLLTKNDRKLIEQKILKITIESVRNRLLGCIPSELIETEEVKSLISFLSKHNLIPPNYPHRDHHFVRRLNQTEPVQNHDLVIEFISKCRSQQNYITPEVVKSIVPILKQRYEQLRNFENNVKTLNYTNAWWEITEVCKFILSIECPLDTIEFTRDVSVDVMSITEPEDDINLSLFQETRANATCILLGTVGVDYLPYDEELHSLIERLSQDQSEKVRKEVAHYACRLYRKDPDLMWAIIEQISIYEKNDQVVENLLGNCLCKLIIPDFADRISRLTKIIFERNIDETTRERCISIFYILYSFFDDKPSENILYEIIKSPLEFSKETYSIVSITSTSNYLVYFSDELSPDKSRLIRVKAFTLLRDIISSVHKELEKFNIEPSKLTKSHYYQSKKTDIPSLIENILWALYSKSGACDEDLKENKSLSIPGDLERALVPLTEEQKKNFLEESKIVLDALATIPAPWVIHDIFKIFYRYINVDPKNILLQINQFLSIETSGYQNDFESIELMKKMMEKFVTDHKEVFCESEACNAFIKILDIFIEAGSPDFHDFTYNLDEIFR